MKNTKKLCFLLIIIIILCNVTSCMPSKKEMEFVRGEKDIFDNYLFTRTDIYNILSEYDLVTTADDENRFYYQDVFFMVLNDTIETAKQIYYTPISFHEAYYLSFRVNNIQFICCRQSEIIGDVLSKFGVEIDHYKYNSNKRIISKFTNCSVSFDDIIEEFKSKHYDVYLRYEDIYFITDDSEKMFLMIGKRKGSSKNAHIKYLKENDPGYEYKYYFYGEDCYGETLNYEWIKLVKDLCK